MNDWTSVTWTSTKILTHCPVEKSMWEMSGLAESSHVQMSSFFYFPEFNDSSDCGRERRLHRSCQGAAEEEPKCQHDGQGRQHSPGHCCQGGTHWDRTGPAGRRHLRQYPRQGEASSLQLNLLLFETCRMSLNGRFLPFLSLLSEWGDDADRSSARRSRGDSPSSAEQIRWYWRQGPGGNPLRLLLIPFWCLNTSSSPSLCSVWNITLLLNTVHALLFFGKVNWNPWVRNPPMYYSYINRHNVTHCICIPDTVDLFQVKQASVCLVLSTPGWKDRPLLGSGERQRDHGERHPAV